MRKKKENDAQKNSGMLTPKQALTVWKLILLGDGQSIKRFSPELTQSDLNGLVSAGLCAIQAGPRKKDPTWGSKLLLTERGWSWANAGFGAKVSRTPAAAPVLEALLAKVGAYLEVHGLALDNVLRPRRAAPEPEPAAGDSSIEERIRAAYLRASGGKYNEHVRLAQLRAALGAEPASVVDAALLGMQRRGGTVLYPVDDPQALGPEDRAAALFVAGARRDLVCIER